MPRGLERAHIHPASLLHKTGRFASPWLVYHARLRTPAPLYRSAPAKAGAPARPRPAFVMDATEASPYALLLFGGALAARPADGVVVVDGWIAVRAVGRVGALVGALRARVAALLDLKIEDPRLSIEREPALRAIARLLLTDGVA